MGSDVEKIIAQMRNRPQNIAFSDLRKVCVEYFGEPRTTKGSHEIFSMPWKGDPRIIIQNDHGKAKRYQVLQALDAIDKKDSL